MPANDVAGGDWSWPSLMLMVLCGSLLAVTLASTTRGLMEQSAARRSPPPPPTPEQLRALALDELGALLAEGIHTNGRLLEFYTRSSGIVRRYVEGVQSSWPTSLTSTELMQRLRTRSTLDVGPLADAMGQAEVVKFGRLQPGAGAAEEHCRTLRDWIAGTGAGPW
jgi:hypothetical protein